MASAAAVGADAARSPVHNTIGEDDGVPGQVTSAISTKEEGLATNGTLEDDEDEDIRAPAKRNGIVTTALDGEDDGQAEEDDLFGDEDEVAAKPPPRQLDDEELDSGDDLDRGDRVQDQAETQEQEYETQVKNVIDLQMARQPLPEPSDGEMYLLKVPDFMEVDPQAWSHDSFQPPTSDHHSEKASSAFSAYTTAMTTLRWRRSPSNPSELQSSARVLRWSDGSLTLQLASQPTVQYEIDGNPLAPPLRNPLKPTPVSVQTGSNKGGRQGDGSIPGEKYDQSKDAFTYLIVPSEATSSLRVAHKVTAGLSLRQPASVQDDAIERLQAALANAANATKVNGAGAIEKLQLIEEDPEKKRREIEMAMKKNAQAAKRREAAIQRESERSNRTLGRSGLSSNRYGGGGLNVGMLEDDDGMATTRGPRRTGATPRKARQRRNSIYSDDEDHGRRRFTTKEDEYDEEDDFLAPSDEEEIVDDDDEDDDDGIVEEPRARERTPKRDRELVPQAAAEAAGDDADAEGEVDEEVQQARTKRRRIVDEDEDEE
ncbi:hypothetical protein BAUCODRAFT_29693 [Baudoinia panamericana UAMH 10762]|uniref:Leo1-like protein n=1 Tax=Baudoinia panamericana (strain UAMH 10762) TaxID=717646 RepID=M2MW77_BAUPA|nr:uncharacterized protein BAUCODRAFT_29693 [Baudoinia panamericana UAMH 10762]EMD01242.1 hypothetical protein BAUCODRAFT_29693 [Baudoinia panamericana UAMH 10762]